MKNNSDSGRKIYHDLVIDFPPRLIKSKSEVRATQKVIESLLDKDSLTDDEQDYLELLITIVKIYEDEKISIPDIYGIEFLKELMKEKNLRQKDLVHIFKTKSVTSEVLNGQRELTFQYVQRLSEYFCVPPSAFLPRQVQIEQEES